MNYKSFYFTFGNIYNNSFPTFLMIFFAFLGYAEKSANLALAISSTILFTQIFSGNMRNIIIASNDIILLNKVRQFRFLTSIIIFFISVLIFYLITKEINSLVISTIILIIVNWINEINIVEKELENEKNKITIFLYINFSFSMFIIFLIYFKLIELIFLLLLFQSVFNFSLFFKKKNLLIGNLDLYAMHFYEIKKYSYAFYSSFSMIFANFVSRSLIFLSLDKNIAGILFASFAIGSFPGTVFNNTFGPLLIKNKIKIPIFLKFFFLILFSILIFLILIMSQSNINYLRGNEVLYFTSLISLLASFFMVYSLYIRQEALQIFFHNQNYIFSFDILLNLILIILTILIVYINKSGLYYFLLLIFSIISMTIYKIMILKLK